MPPNNTSQLAIRELDELIKLGDGIIAMAAGSAASIRGSSLAEIMAWAARAGHIIRSVAGEGSLYDAAFASARAGQFSFIHSDNYEQLCEVQGALQGLRHALDAGLLHDLKRLLQADIFADFLEMAEHLLAEGYKDAAAVLIGGVLEDALRKLSAANNLPVVGSNGKPLTIDPLNANLARAGIYQPLTKKQLTSWADLRNNAAHGQYTKYSDNDVREMLFFAQRFCGDFMQ